jgi:hypothetical protein
MIRESQQRCSYCGSEFPNTRSTRKYCTARCKTYACLDRNQTRLRASEVKALRELLGAHFESAEELRDRLRDIIAPGEPHAQGEAKEFSVPTLD